MTATASCTVSPPPAWCLQTPLPQLLLVRAALAPIMGVVFARLGMPNPYLRSALMHAGGAAVTAVQHLWQAQAFRASRQQQRRRQQLAVSAAAAGAAAAGAAAAAAARGGGGASASGAGGSKGGRKGEAEGPSAGEEDGPGKAAQPAGPRKGEATGLVAPGEGSAPAEA